MNTFDSTPRRSRKKKRQKLPASGGQGPGGPARLHPVTSQPATALRPRDDLILIEGIDPAIEMALNSIGIQKFSNFRGYSPESLSEALQIRTGIEISASSIARLDWLGWAEILAAEETAAPAHANVEAEKKEDQSRETAGAQNEEHHDAISDENRQIVVTVDDLPAEESAAQNVEAQELEAAKAAWEAKNSPREASLRIKDARFATFEKKATAGTPMGKILRSEILCEFAGPVIIPAEPIHFVAQLHAVHSHTGESQLLASQSQRLEPEHADYRIALESRIPKAGLYQLQIIALLLQPGSRAAFRRGPDLRVVP